MAVLTVQQSTINGVQPNFVSADVAGDQFVNNGRIFFEIVNGDVSTKTVTINSITNCSQGFDHDIAIAVPAGERRIAGPFATSRFNNSLGQVELNYDAVTSVTIAVISL